MIHCIGDSHVSLFNGGNYVTQCYNDGTLPGFKCHNVSAHLAYNVYDHKHEVNKKIIDVINMYVSKNDTIMFMFGEIDCRLHIIKNINNFNGQMQHTVEDCVKRYLEGINKYARGYSIMVFSPHPTFKHPQFEELNIGPHFGTYEEINLAKMWFHCYLLKLSKHKVISIYTDFLYEKNEYYKDKSFYIDDTHLSVKALPIVFKKMKKQRILLDYDYEIYFQKSKELIDKYIKKEVR